MKNAFSVNINPEDVINDAVSENVVFRSEINVTVMFRKPCCLECQRKVGF
jgi:hypothetical protein